MMISLRLLRSRVWPHRQDHALRAPPGLQRPARVGITFAKTANVTTPCAEGSVVATLRASSGQRCAPDARGGHHFLLLFRNELVQPKSQVRPRTQAKAARHLTLLQVRILLILVWLRAQVLSMHRSSKRAAGCVPRATVPTSAWPSQSIPEPAVRLSWTKLGE